MTSLPKQQRTGGPAQPAAHVPLPAPQLGAEKLLHAQPAPRHTPIIQENDGSAKHPVAEQQHGVCSLKPTGQMPPLGPLGATHAAPQPQLPELLTAAPAGHGHSASAANSSA